VTFKIKVAYDGTRYVGWQRQAEGVSIQGLLESALREIEGREVSVAGAGRTDAGVHATGQVASFALERVMAPDVLMRALNAHLPHDVRVMQAVPAAAGFHARFAARAKTYLYRLCTHAVVTPFEHLYVWHVPAALDVGAMERAARVLEGRHDFAAFQGAGSATRTTERTVRRSGMARAPWWIAAAAAQSAPPVAGTAGPDLLVYEITGDGFLRHMVRVIVGTLVEIGRGRWPSERMGEVLASGDRRCAGPTAPAAGLFLVDVDYGDL
jgi:tRNA pseudouridine38-40 synthase